MKRNTLSLVELSDEILEQMKASGFSETTRGIYKTIFHKLSRIAAERGDERYSKELGKAFVQDDSHIIPENSERYFRERTGLYRRCIQFIESFLETGKVDFSPASRRASFEILSADLCECFSRFLLEMEERKLKANTKEGYRRFTYYFIQYLENKGYNALEDIREGDVVSFISVICTTRYQPTSLGAHLPGLKIFLGMYACTKRFLVETPEHLPKKRDILKIYSDEEYRKISEYLNNAKELSCRNKAIALIALSTGLRAVDICSLKLNDIDWLHNYIRIVQQKTDHPHIIPLTNETGNAVVDYLLEERPAVDSPFVFLRSIAPFQPLACHSSIRKVLFDIINDSDIHADGRIYGTRITRHSSASRLLRNGTPLPVISDLLGHKDKESVMIYITTDDRKMAECTLPLPKGGAYHG